MNIYWRMHQYSQYQKTHSVRPVQTGGDKAVNTPDDRTITADCREKPELAINGSDEKKRKETKRKRMKRNKT